MSSPYPPDSVDNHPDNWMEDNGTMPENIERLTKYVVGHRIASVESKTGERFEDDQYRMDRCAGLVITLDNGIRVALADNFDCCAHTELERFLLYHDKIDHLITGVASTNGYTNWHIYADAGDVLELTVNWSPGNAFYYGYGFDIGVVPIEGQVVDEQAALLTAPASD